MGGVSEGETRERKEGQEDGVDRLLWSLQTRERKERGTGRKKRVGSGVTNSEY